MKLVNAALNLAEKKLNKIITGIKSKSSISRHQSTISQRKCLTRDTEHFKSVKKNV